VEAGCRGEEKDGDALLCLVHEKKRVRKEGVSE
jgi:hypothetical protein